MYIYTEYTEWLTRWFPLASPIKCPFSFSWDSRLMGFRITSGIFSPHPSTVHAAFQNNNLWWNKRHFSATSRSLWCRCHTNRAMGLCTQWSITILCHWDLNKTQRACSVVHLHLTDSSCQSSEVSSSSVWKWYTTQLILIILGPSGDNLLFHY